MGWLKLSNLYSQNTSQAYSQPSAFSRLIGLNLSNTRTSRENIFLTFGSVAKYILITLALLISTKYYLFVHSWAALEESDPIKISIEASNNTIESVCEEILAQTSYKIIFDGLTLDNKISLKLNNVSLSEALTALVERTARGYELHHCQ